MSRAVPIAQPLPEGFSIRKAIQCAHLVNVAYDLYQQWSDAGKPEPHLMRFRPVVHGQLVFSDPFWRTLTYRTPRESGGKGGPRIRNWTYHANFAVALCEVLKDEGISTVTIPWGQLVTMLLVAVGVGVVAALWPALRASRLPVLEAIATE